MKIQNIISGALATLLITAAFTITANAGMQTQTDTNSLAAASTNTFKLSGDTTGSFTNGQTFPDAQIIDGTKSTSMDCAVGGFFTNTAAGASNIVFTIAATVDNANWTNASKTVTVSVPAASTNWAVTLFNWSAPPPGVSLRSVANANASAVSGRAGTLYFKAYTKTGL